MQTSHQSAVKSQQQQSSSASSTAGINTPSIGLPRIAASIALGGIATFGIFVLMHELISNNDVEVVKVEPIPLISSIYEEKDETIRSTRREIEPPPPVLTPPDVSRDTLPIDPITGIGFEEPGLTGIEPVTTDENTGIFNMASDARPIVRIDPQYPESAARDGIEGWVELSFSIDESGSVRDVVVTDSEPKRTFDRAAKRALQRWKYQAKREDGKSVVQEGLSVMLEFKLSS
ncbi:energy transducer TonB [Glaciecola sp. MF2-115]|uniref:energy transducer TonB n=1 Tax=Glaciecola sp. MF2-115 TaxID=3384827 RepID=UPI0039A38185